MIKRVFFEPTGKLHPAFRYLLDFPPEGYEYVLPGGWWKKLLRQVENQDVIYYNLWRLSKYVPLMLLKSKLDGIFQAPPPGSSLTFAISHVVTRDEPWVLFAEWVHMLVGWDIQKLRKHREELEQYLMSSNCKKILTWCEPARQSFLHHLECSRFKDKIDILPLACRSRQFTKIYRDERVRLLFVGSAHAPKGLGGRLGTKQSVYDFHIKGGKEVIEAFLRLKRQYSNLELTVRANVPSEYRRRYSGVVGLRLIERQIPWKQLEEEFMEADIYVFPCHQTTPWGSILDAMSFELPVIATDVYANAEIVKNGITGFLIEPSQKVNYYDPTEPFIPPMNTTPGRRIEFLKSIAKLDERVVDDLTKTIALMVEDKGLRRRMGRAGRREVEEGDHSVKKRNLKLKTIFDEAVR